MKKEDNIYVAGHTGMVVFDMQTTKKENYKNIITATHRELSLDNEQEVQRFFLNNKIDYASLAAAKVEGY